MKVLFMPLLRIPSGHHHVADSIKEQLKTDFTCEKVEILSYCYGNLETFISSIYLYWIHKLPKVYSKMYKQIAVRGLHRKRFYTYEGLFLRKTIRLLREINPDVVICTHALPSYIMNRLKEKKQWNGIVINIYTDFFINDLWGKLHIDFHFVPCFEVKQELIARGVKESKILVTGIPVHPIFQSSRKLKKHPRTILISGGNMGAGSMKQIVEHLQPSGTITYKVLCGQNKDLFQFIQLLNHPSIQPISYLSSKEEMNRLYEEAAAIITKPGGVTISECLWKRLPIFVYEALPGQEEFNFHYLQQQGLIFPLDYNEQKIEEYLLRTLESEFQKMEKRFEWYTNNIEIRDIRSIMKDILMKKPITS